ncbi:myelin expression factor [Acrasis kona]|uniref:Myelin expression factor n=1 Tax=Acrasis kona TaxID=1008807 RepID=A0AAW2ZRR0_9EUKA
MERRNQNNKRQLEYRNNNNNNNGNQRVVINDHRNKRHKFNQSDDDGFDPNDDRRNINIMPNEDLKYYIFLTNLPFNTSWQELKNFSTSCGDVVFARIFKGNDGQSKGYGLVRFEREDQANKAMRTLNNKQIGNRCVNVYPAEKKSSIRPKSNNNNTNNTENQQQQQHAFRDKEYSPAPYKEDEYYSPQGANGRRSQSPASFDRGSSRSPRRSRSRSRSSSYEDSRSISPENRGRFSPDDNHHFNRQQQPDTNYFRGDDQQQQHTPTNNQEESIHVKEEYNNNNTFDVNTSPTSSSSVGNVSLKQISKSELLELIRETRQTLNNYEAKLRAMEKHERHLQYIDRELEKKRKEMDELEKKRKEMDELM